MIFKNFLIENQYDINFLKNFAKKCWSDGKKVVLLHPLSEGERGLNRGEPGAKFFESLRPARASRHEAWMSKEGT